MEEDNNNHKEKLLLLPYNPKYYNYNKNNDILYDFIEKYNFGSLISLKEQNEIPFITQIPFLLQKNENKGIS